MADEKNKHLIALRKAKALIEKIIGMAEDKKYCIDIMQQCLAAIGLLKSANQEMLQNHLGHCFRSAMKSASEVKQQKMIEEILKVVKNGNK